MQLTLVCIVSFKRNVAAGEAYCPLRYNLKVSVYKTTIEQAGEFIMGGEFCAKHTVWGARLVTSKVKNLCKAHGESGSDFHFSGRPSY